MQGLFLKQGVKSVGKEGKVVYSQAVAVVIEFVIQFDQKYCLSLCQKLEVMVDT